MTAPTVYRSPFYIHRKGSNRGQIGHFYPVLRVIAEYIAAYGMSPTFREIADQRATSTSVAAYGVNRLAEAGLIEFDRNTSRSLRVTPEGYEAIEMPSPGAERLTTLEAAVEEALNDLRVALVDSPYISETGVRHAVERLGIALDVARAR